MKYIFFSLAVATIALFGCTQNPTTNENEDTNPLESIAETDSVEAFKWPDSIVHLTAANPQECYFDKTFAAYAADTAFFAFEETCIEKQCCFVASRIQPLKMPDEWRNDKELSDMVNYYNYVAVMHAIETDYDAYERYTNDPSDYDEEEPKAKEEADAKIRRDFFAELDRINLNALSDKKLQNSIKTFIGKIKEVVSSDEETEDDDMWDISGIINELTESWVPDLDQVDSVGFYKWVELVSPNHYLPQWVPDVFGQFLGQEAKPTLDDKMNIFTCFDEAENYNEKAAWGFVVLGVHPLAPCEGLLQDVEEMFSSGCYSPLLDALWRAYRVKYNDTNSCPSTYCYSPNLRYNHFRRMIAYTTLRHIEAHPNDELARLQYYYMVMHTDILRLNHPYPFGNSAATEAILLYWSQMLLYY